MFLMILSSSCLNQNKSFKVLDSNSVRTRSRAKTRVSDKTAISEKLNNESFQYFFESDTLKQNVEVKTLSDSTIRFLLISENKINGKIAKIQGVAKSMTHVDPEIDDDEEGNAYPAKEFIYNDKCILHIRIDMLQKDKLIVKEGGGRCYMIAVVHLNP